MPPPSYEEDSAQQAAQSQSRSYVYAYPQYYPGQVRYYSSDRDHISSVLTLFIANDAWNGTAPAGYIYALALYASYALSTHDAPTER